MELMISIIVTMLPQFMGFVTYGIRYPLDQWSQMNSHSNTWKFVKRQICGPNAVPTESGSLGNLF